MVYNIAYTHTHTHTKKKKLYLLFSSFLALQKNIYIVCNDLSKLASSTNYSISFINVWQPYARYVVSVRHTSYSSSILKTHKHVYVIQIYLDCSRI